MAFLVEFWWDAAAHLKSDQVRPPHFKRDGGAFRSVAILPRDFSDGECLRFPPPLTARQISGASLDRRAEDKLSTPHVLPTRPGAASNRHPRMARDQGARASSESRGAQARRSHAQRHQARGSVRNLRGVSGRLRRPKMASRRWAERVCSLERRRGPPRERQSTHLGAHS